MKISRVKHVVITSIIFLVIIAVIVGVYSSMLSALTKNTEGQVYRVIAKRDILPGEEITTDNAEEVVTAPGKFGEKLAVYRLRKEDKHLEVKQEDTKGKKGNLPAQSNGSNDDGRWAIGKIAKDKIYKGQVLLTSNLISKAQDAGEKTRLYAIPFDSSTTGGYNINLGQKVDICVLYGEDEKTIAEYQTLADNKAIDIVLPEKQIADIRDEAGNSRKIEANAGVVPGYICFNLTYDEINKLEVAKRQGTLFVAIAANYYKAGNQVSTFMPGKEMPKF